MINQRMYELGSEPSAIRELFAYGQARKAEIGEDNVFDFSIGNPSVPAPEAVKRAILDVMEQPPAQVHGYTPSQGAPSVRAAVAASLNRRFDMNYGAGDLFMTSGAAGALAHAIRLVAQPGDEIVTFAPLVIYTG